MFVARKEEMVPWHKLMPCIHTNTHFRNGPRTATKRRETTPNMSFGPKVLDWACSLRKKKKWFRWHKPMPCIRPDAGFPNGSRAATKWRETTPNMSFVPKVVVRLVGCEKRRNGSGGTNSCLVYTPMPVFQMAHAQQRNGAKPPQT